MKHILMATAAVIALASPAFAADMPVRQPVYKAAPVPVPSWTGCYVGGHAGWAHFDDKVVDVDSLNGGAHFKIKDDNFIGGGQLGCNIQNGQFVYGIEADLGDLNTDKRAFDPNFPNGTFAKLRGGFYGDVTARAGFVLSNNALLYAKGGWAYFDGDAIADNTRGGFGGSGSTSGFNGWTIGGGVEWMLSPAWTFKVEYQHFDFGKETATIVTPINGNFRYSHDLSVDAVMVGFNYKFSDWGR